MSLGIRVTGEQLARSAVEVTGHNCTRGGLLGGLGHHEGTANNTKRKRLYVVRVLAYRMRSIKRPSDYRSSSDCDLFSPVPRQSL